jgi:endonuclease YncB( thermonuclease family)
MAPVSMQAPPPGWYPDPEGPPGQVRYWDGGRWTPQRHAYAAPVAPARPPSSKAWVAWVVAGVVALGAIGAVIDDGDDEPSGHDTSSTAVSTDDDGADAVDTGEPESDEAHAADEDPNDGQAVDPAVAAPPASETASKTYKVAYVTDGDTLHLSNGADVRLVGIDAPEEGKCGSIRATDLLTRLVEGKRVTLAAPVDDRDRYGRLLRYVNIGTMDAGLRMIKNGLAIARYDSQDGYDAHPRQLLYHRADDAAPNVKCAPAQAVPLAGGGGSHCASGYSPCIPPYPPDLDCADVDGPIYVTGSDPHGLDADDDGVACE